VTKPPAKHPNKKTKTNPTGAGRKAITLSDEQWEYVENQLKAQGSGQEIRRQLKISYDTLSKLCCEKYECSDFTEVKQQKKTEGSDYLKYVAFEQAVELAKKGNPTLLIFLLKAFCGLSENPQNTVETTSSQVLTSLSNCMQHQHSFIFSRSKNTALVGGYRSGKTHSSVYKYLVKAQERQGKCRMFIGAPTYPLLRDINIPKFKQVFDELGIVYQYHKQEYRIEVLTADYKGEIIFRPLEDPDRLIGFEITDFILDEFDLLKTDLAKEVWEKMIARTSGCADATCSITTTPEGFRYTHDLFVNQKKGKLIQAKTTDNWYLPQDYIDSLYAQYDAKLVEQYINGQFVNINNQAAYYSFIRGTHIREYKQPLPATIIIGMDFNISPMTSVLMSYDGNILHVFDEFYMSNANTRMMIEAIRAKYPDNEILVCPDMTGGSRKTSAEQTDIQLLQRAGFKTKGTSNIRVRDRLNIVNGALFHKEILIDPKCVHLINDFEQCVTDQYGELDKSNMSLTHISDAFGYATIQYKMAHRYGQIYGSV